MNNLISKIRKDLFVKMIFSLHYYCDRTFSISSDYFVKETRKLCDKCDRQSQ